MLENPASQGDISTERATTKGNHTPKSC